MLVKNLCIRSSNCYPYQFLALNFKDCNVRLRQFRNYRLNLMSDNRRAHLNHQNLLTSNRWQYFNLQNLSPQLNILRYKSTNSSGECEKKKNVDNDNLKENTAEPLTRAQKLKKAVKEYGSTVIVFHIGISLMSLGICYATVVSGVNVEKVFMTLGLNEWVSNSQIASTAGTFAVAYAIHKVFAPVRMAITLTCVPLIVRHLRKIGILKQS